MHTKLIIIIIITVAGCTDAPAGYTLVNGKHYKIYHTAPTNYHEARLACHQEGAHLAMMKTAQDYNTVLSFASKAKLT